jgi:hypothetical protein
VERIAAAGCVDDRGIEGWDVQDLRRTLGGVGSAWTVGEHDRGAGVTPQSIDHVRRFDSAGDVASEGQRDHQVIGLGDEGKDALGRIAFGIEDDRNSCSAGALHHLE